MVYIFKMTMRPAKDYWRLLSAILGVATAILLPLVAIYSGNWNVYAFGAGAVVGLIIMVLGIMAKNNKSSSSSTK